MVMVKPLTLLVAAIPSVLGATFTVTVGIDQNTGQVGTGYDPDRIVPAVGDQIIFSWAIPSYIDNPQTGSYSVTQGSPDGVCQPLSGGFDSGPQTTAPEAAGNAPTQTFDVTSSDPLYFYSNVDGQCQGGMALGVNTPATGDGSIDSYIGTATGAATPPGSGNSTVTANATSTPTDDTDTSINNNNVTSTANVTDTSNTTTTTGNDTSTTNNTDTNPHPSTPLPTPYPGSSTQNYTNATLQSSSSSSHSAPTALPTSGKSFALPRHALPSIWFVSAVLTLVTCMIATVL